MILMPLHGSVVTEHDFPEGFAEISKAWNVAVWCNMLQKNKKILSSFFAEQNKPYKALHIHTTEVFDVYHFPFQKYLRPDECLILVN